MTAPSTTAVASTAPRKRMCDGRITSCQIICGPNDSVDRLLELTYRAEQSHFWFRGFRQYMKPALARAVAGVPAPRILDCGCGTGSNLEMLRRYGRTVGFDLTATGAQFAKAHGHAVAQASIADIPFRSGTFDL